MKNKKLTVDEIYQANIEAFNIRRKLPYTKKRILRSRGMYRRCNEILE